MSVGDALRPVTRPRLYEQVVSQIQAWIAENGLEVGDRLPPERELASRLGVSRATVSQALVAMEVVGMVSVRHGDGVDPRRAGRFDEGRQCSAPARPAAPGDHRGAGGARDQARRAGRRATDRERPRRHRRGPGRHGARHRRRRAGRRRRRALPRRGDGRRSLAAAGQAHGRDQRPDQGDADRVARPSRSGRSTRCTGHRKIADAIRARDPEAAAQAMQEHIAMVSDVALLRS